MRCGHILSLSFAYCSPVPLALGWFYSDIWAKRTAVIRITIRAIIWGGTLEKALLAREASHCWRELASCKEYKLCINYRSYSGGRRGHIAKLQPHFPQAPATTCLRPLAVPLDCNFRHRFGVPVLACNEIATMDSAEIGHPERSPKSVAVSVLKCQKRCCDSP